MAGDCPHRTELESAIRQCQSQHGVITDTYVDYLTIINELICDLEVISHQVQEDFAEQGIEPSEHLEKTLKELATHNALLQQRLESTEKFKEAVCVENEVYKKHIQMLERNICDKDERISQLTARIESQGHDCELECDALRACKEQQLRQLRDELHASCQKMQSLHQELEESHRRERFNHNEARKFNDELLELKRKHSELQAENRRLGHLLKNQEANRMEQVRKCEELEISHEALRKQLRATAHNLSTLQDRCGQREQQDHHYEHQRTLLQNEIASLKELVAAKSGETKSLKDQLKHMENDIRSTHNNFNKTISHMQSENSHHQQQIGRLMNENNELKIKLQSATDNISMLNAQFNSQEEIMCKNRELIESYKSWKDAQIKADQATIDSRQQYEDHITHLLQEKQNFLDSYRQLDEEYCCIKEELERVRASNRATSPGPPLSSSHPMNDRIEFMRHTSLRLEAQSDSMRRQNIMNNRPSSSSKYQK